MSWIKEANKIGDYYDTKDGFRIYCIINPSHVTTETDSQIKDEFVSGEYIAVDKTGLKFLGTLMMIWAKIDKEMIKRKMQQKYKEELYWD